MLQPASFNKPVPTPCELDPVDPLILGGFKAGVNMSILGFSVGLSVGFFVVLFVMGGIVVLLIAVASPRIKWSILLMVDGSIFGGLNGNDGRGMNGFTVDGGFLVEETGGGVDLNVDFVDGDFLCELVVVDS